MVYTTTKRSDFLENLNREIRHSSVCLKKEIPKIDFSTPSQIVHGAFI
jgi:hypothetical protein